MLFSKILRIVLMFYNLALKKAKVIAAETVAGGGAVLSLEHATLVVQTGFVTYDQPMTGEITSDGVFILNFPTT